MKVTLEIFALRSTSLLNRILVGRRDDDDFKQFGFLGLIAGSEMR